jgi:hypothetical protein
LSFTPFSGHVIGEAFTQLAIKGAQRSVIVAWADPAAAVTNAILRSIFMGLAPFGFAGFLIAVRRP